MGSPGDCGYYPIFLDLRGQSCLVVGGGAVAARKAKGLRSAGASVTVVAPMIDERLKTDPQLRVCERPFRTADLHGMTVVIAATDDAVLNRTVARDARDLDILVNVVDCPSLCSFILPANLKLGPVQVSISTAGTSPTLARKLRDRVAESIGPEFGVLAELLGEVRARAVEGVSDPTRRANLFDRLTDEHFLVLIREGSTDQARAEMRKLIDDNVS